MSLFNRNVAIGCLAGGLAIALSARQVYHEYLLSRHAQETQATVISKNSGHGWIEYSYVVAGATYEGSTPAISTGKPFEKVSVGDKLAVQFDPTNPGVSGTPETREAIESTVPFMFFGFAVLSVIAFLQSRLPKP